MTKEDIKKALEICTDIDRPCGSCPYDNVTNCSDTLKHDMYKLAIEQENEINELKDGYAQVQEQFAQYQMASDKEIAAQVKQAQIDVLKELKTRHDYAVKNMGYPWDISQQIDELIKEIQNEQKD